MALFALGCLVLVQSVGCRSPRASPEDCARIFDRMVDVELKELGYRDPILAQLKRKQLKQRFAAEIGKCVGGKLSPHGLSCIESAQTTEQISHVCLR
jgi:hypothetical protein